MRLAFQQLGSDQWAAGNLFLDSMFRALRMLGPDRPTLVLLADEAAAESEYQDLTANVDEVLRAPVRAPTHEALMRESLRYHIMYWLRARALRRPPKKNRIRSRPYCWVKTSTLFSQCPERRRHYNRTHVHVLLISK